MHVVFFSPVIALTQEAKRLKDLCRRTMFVALRYRVVRACAVRHSQMWMFQTRSQSCMFKNGSGEAFRRLASAARLGQEQVNRCYEHN